MGRIRSYVITLPRNVVYLDKSKLSFINKIDSKVFMDREYIGQHCLRIRGIYNPFLAKVIKDNLKCNARVSVVNRLSFFDNQQQSELYDTINSEMFHFFSQFYFSNDHLDDIVEDALGTAEFLSCNHLLQNEGYQSHMSHLWAFLVGKIEPYQTSKIISIFKKMKQESHPILGNLETSCDLGTLVNKVKALIIAKQINFISPLHPSILHKDDFLHRGFATLIHKETFSNCNYAKYINRDQYLILNRWYLNSLYVNLTLIGIPLIYKYYINYYIASKYYNVDRSISYYLKEGREKLWLNG